LAIVVEDKDQTNNRNRHNRDVRFTSEADICHLECIATPVRDKLGASLSPWLKPAPDDYLQVWPVSRRVNSSLAASDDQSLIVQIAA
jgi:hypothetical protein